MGKILAKLFGKAGGGLASKISSIVDKFVHTKDEQAAFKKEMDNSIDDLLDSENIKNPPRIIIGSEFENPTVLNRNDASGERGIWAQNDIYSYWKVNFKKGTYDFKFKFKDSITSKGTLFTEINNRVYSKKTEKVKKGKK